MRPYVCIDVKTSPTCSPRQRPPTAPHPRPGFRYFRLSDALRSMFVLNLQRTQATYTTTIARQTARRRGPSGACAPPTPSLLENLKATSQDKSRTFFCAVSRPARTTTPYNACARIASCKTELPESNFLRYPAVYIQRVKRLLGLNLPPVRGRLPRRHVQDRVVGSGRHTG